VEEADLDLIEARFHVQLPAAYRQYLVSHGPGPMEAHDDFYVEIMGLKDLEAVNEEVRDTFPGLFYIGDNGSREHLALDFRREPPAVVMTDFTSGAEGVVEQASTFEEFVDMVRSRGLVFDGET
jgi:hypothetical protein